MLVSAKGRTSSALNLGGLLSFERPQAVIDGDLVTGDLTSDLLPGPWRPSLHRFPAFRGAMGGPR